MASRKGSLLERNVEQLLRLSGFDPRLNVIHSGYEIDVFLSYKNLRIGFECKQYERSTLAIRNLIHQWDSKNKELKFDKNVLVLIGCDISSKDYQLAERYGIIIWDEAKLASLSDNAIEKRAENKDNILKELGIEARINEMDRLIEELGKVTEKARKTGTLEDNIHGLEILVKNGIKVSRFAMKELDFYNEQGIDIKEVLLDIKSTINSLYSSVFLSIIASLKSTILSPKNKDNVPEKSIEEFKKFIKKWDKYIIHDTGEEPLISKEEYDKFREKVKELDDTKKIGNLYEILTKIENEKLGKTGELVSKIDELDGEFTSYVKSRTGLKLRRGWKSYIKGGLNLLR